MPSGWWHAVDTISNGAILVGESLHTAVDVKRMVRGIRWTAANSNWGQASQELKQATRAFCDANDLSVPKRSRYRPQAAERFGTKRIRSEVETIRRFIAQVEGGTTRRDSSGRRRRKRVRL